MWQSSSSFSDSKFRPLAMSSSPHTVGIPRYNTLLLVKSRPNPKPKPNPTRTPLPIESVTCSLVLLQKDVLAAPECSCSSTKTAANVARMKAQLSTATSTGRCEDVSTLGVSESASSTPSLWSTELMGDLRCTWFWWRHDVPTRWLWGGQDRHSASSGPEHVRHAGWQTRHACTEDCSTQFSRERLRSCSPGVKPGGQDFTQPCRKSHKPALHSENRKRNNVYHTNHMHPNYKGAPWVQPNRFNLFFYRHYVSE